MRFSCVIPCYEMHGKGVEYLQRALESIHYQNFKDYEIIVSDNSKDEKIFRLCENYTVRYFWNPEIGMATNTNYGIKEANGELIKILYQDDWLAREDCLRIISENFNNPDEWMIMGCSNNPKPFYSARNTLGSPSVLTIRNSNPLFFNTKLKWTLDLEYYKRMYKKFGAPKIIEGIWINMGLGPHQATNHLSLEEKLNEQL